MKDERFKDIMKALGYPDSHSLLGALKQVANEVAQETSKDLQAKLDSANSHIALTSKLLDKIDDKKYKQMISTYRLLTPEQSLAAIQANAIRSILDADYTCETPNGDDAWSRSAIEEIANNAESSGQLDK